MYLYPIIVTDKMASIIRTKTFIKYARIKLQEAESAIQEENLSAAIKLCSDCNINLIKALGNFVEGYNPEKILNDPNALLKLLIDLIGNKKEAKSISKELLELKDSDQYSNISRQQCEQIFSKTGKLFSKIHNYCFPE